AEPGRLRTGEEEGRARDRWGEEGARVVIVRLMGGGGQYRVDNSLLERLNELDDQAVAALARGGEAELGVGRGGGGSRSPRTTSPRPTSSSRPATSRSTRRGGCSPRTA